MVYNYPRFLAHLSDEIDISGDKRPQQTLRIAESLERRQLLELEHLERNIDVQLLHGNSILPICFMVPKSNNEKGKKSKSKQHRICIHQ